MRWKLETNHSLDSKPSNLLDRPGRSLLESYTMYLYSGKVFHQSSVLIPNEGP